MGRKGKQKGKHVVLVLFLALAGSIRAGTVQIAAADIQEMDEDTIPIGFLDTEGDAIDLTKPQEVVYGDAGYKIQIDEEAFQTAAGDITEEDVVTYTCEVKEDGISEKVLTVDKDGNVEFQRASETPVYVTVTRDDCRQHPGTAAEYPIIVKKRKITIDTSCTGLIYSKIYDRESEVFHDGNTDVIQNMRDIPLKGLVTLPGEAEDDVYITELKGIMAEDIADAGVYDDVGVVLTEAKLESSTEADGYPIKDNYELNVAENPVILKMQVRIGKRRIALKVADGKREYGHWNEVTYGNEAGTDPVQENRDVYIDTAVEGLIEGDEVIYPEAGETKDRPKPDYPLNMDTGYAEKLVIYGTGNPGNNYYFDFDTVVNGTLKIEAENIRKGRDYLDFQEEARTVYISPVDDKIWINGNAVFRVKLKETEQTAYYNKIITMDGIDLTTEGKDFSDVKDGSRTDLEVQLADTVSGAKSRSFIISLYIDRESPAVVRTDIVSDQKNNGTASLTEALTFGTFHKQKSAKQNVEVSDYEGSGIRQWFYNIMRGSSDTDFTREAVEAYTASTNAECKWTMVKEKMPDTDCAETTGYIPLPDEENNYVVLIRVTDNVGHDKIFASNGVIIDYTAPQAVITLAKGQFQSDTGIYGEDVRLNIHVEDICADGKNSKSAIKRVDVRVESDGKQTDFQTLLDMESTDSKKKGTGKKSWTLDEIEEYSFVDLPYTVTAKDNNSNHIKVTAIVTDNAGNQLQDTVSFHLMIDTDSPEITENYTSTAEAKNGYYYNAPVQGEIIYKERNFSASGDYLWFEVQEEGRQMGRYSAEQLTSELGIKTTWKEKEDLHTLTLIFEKDNHYTIAPYIKDLAKRADDSAEPVIKGKEQYFVIDRTAPVMTVQYETADHKALNVPQKTDDRVYRNQAVSAIVTIEEHNFALDGKEVQAEVTVEAENVQEGKKIPDYYAQQRQNNNHVWKASGTDLHRSVYQFEWDANYTHCVAYKDLAGNVAVLKEDRNKSGYGPGCFTVDKTEPSGKISVDGVGFWERLLEKITFGLFSPASVKVTMTGADHTSLLKPLQYAKVRKRMTGEELNAYKEWEKAPLEEPETAELKVKPNEQFIIYTKVTDYAGNYQFFSSDGIITDDVKPVSAVTITNLSQARSGIFNKDVELQIDAEDKTEGNTYSGLKKVWYVISASGNVTKTETIELLDDSSHGVQGNQTFRKVITVPADVYNSNDVKVQAFALDFAGNESESEVTELKIDVTNPEISVSWNLNTPLNDCFYKETRTAAVTVKERNFSPEHIKFSITNTDGVSADIGKWFQSGGDSDDAVNTCHVSFSSDGDYTFTLACTDLAGNTGKYDKTDTFTIDKTPPVLCVSYDNHAASNGNFYREARTATVSIQEHNFRADEVRGTITASLDGKTVTAPHISSFTDSGDIHTAVICYEQEGDYTFDINYTDMAGNEAADYAQDIFTVDLTAPEVEITEIADKSANKDVVSPGIKITDRNCDIKNIAITLTGKNHGPSDMPKMVNTDENGQYIKFSDFERKEETDDLYTLSAKAVDRAGNETEKTVLFSVNRYGSVYVLDDDTNKTKGGWLSTDPADYTYISREKELGITEYNVDEIEDCRIVINRDGELENLEEREDYTVQKSGSGTQWREQRYRIKADNFAKEGNYEVILATQDRAKNLMNNNSVKKSGGKLPIRFTVDKTAPTVVVSGIKDGGRYRLKEKEFLVDAKDNLALAQVSVCIGDDEIIYTEEDLRNKDGIAGILKLAVASAENWQKIRVSAKDMAGNMAGKTAESQDGKPIVMKVLVTPNIWTQYYMNKPLFWSSAAGILLIAGIVFFILRKRILQKQIQVYNQ